MSLQVIGAGLGRTGTTSLREALEQLLGGPCYHMLEVRERTGDPDTVGAMRTKEGCQNGVASSMGTPQLLIGQPPPFGPRSARCFQKPSSCCQCGMPTTGGGAPRTLSSWHSRPISLLMLQMMDGPEWGAG